MIVVVETSYRAPRPAPVVAERAEPVVARRSIQTLADVRELHVEGMKGELDEFIREEIGKQLSGRMRAVESGTAADAVLQVTVEDRKGGTVSKAGRFLGLKDKLRITAVVRDTASKKTLWTCEVGDRMPVVGAFKSDTARRVAARVVKEMKDDLR